MKTLILGGAFALVAGLAHADPLEGTWKTKTDDNGNYGHVQVVPCGNALCGTLIKSFGGDGKELASSPNKGKQLIWDVRPAGSDGYEGKVFSPDRNKTYDSKLRLTGNKLKVSGCIMGICRDGGTWTRLQ